ncbi:glutathione peroxidase [Pedobacter sp. PACM 27299]|uniref:glutathione peroxidase n=1 Tax=Pedobacter sp. PACM 27299 TaxID=1727164 RepID=UPI0007059EA9|nr:glutathione peroxidase [Pedobacter sp. PACM 27299]ALL06548.1 glutathione peroxidase [Pedobacter sp. PACM 27299]
MNTLLILLSLIFTPPAKSIYDFNFRTIDGKVMKMSQFKGKKILIVNTASKCGYTPQYEDLEKLSKQYGKEVVLIGFPAGNFGGQELATNSEIQDFCKKNFGVTFLLSEKVSVKGDDINPLFKYLTTAANPDFTGDINWNFEKFLINEKGELVHRFRSKVKPLSEELTKNL